MTQQKTPPMKGEADRTYVSITFSNLSRAEADRVVKAALGSAPSMSSFSVHYSDAIIIDGDELEDN